MFIRSKVHFAAIQTFQGRAQLGIKVKNVNGVATSDCRCGSWLKHWDKFSSNRIGFCRVEGCANIAEVGAHVQKESDPKWYVVPFCQLHNSMGAPSYFVIEGTTFVSANVVETCGLADSTMTEQ